MILKKINLLKKGFIVFLLSVFMFSIISHSVSATSLNSDIEEINILTKKALEEKEATGEASDITIEELNKQLQKIGVNNNPYSDFKNIEYSDDFTFYGYGETHDAGQGWKYRVDRPSSKDAKPHVHVEKGKVKAVENVDGTPSHGKTLAGSGVPKKIIDKVKSSKDYKKGQADLAKLKQAKAEIKKKHLNLNNVKDLAIAAGIIAGLVGVAFFAPEAIPFVIAAV
ncbi:hypothetical protein CW676_11785 [Macrococcoides caseolyticum]|uniref:hypothetical protein n=2 Tax=Macrococcoides caseolyticum TaxID=69966 RepID=UPI000C34A40F|nr:hypothetical protein [Macrococcus caseolyticus]PKE05765.1 hypothetical protein CW692_11740 [Macrococcus caseolyticus]PKE22969.1 hypothetical protein CW689_11620 [Macrococcus caseolyticus]PKE48250.1 hypothetical protein CW672_10900 [Macrococcus caseolyticus]PKE51935.1 hypothetical protein CW676_11785 [Macrococcus caseolyticus]PKF37481.1 hypothetical protein CW681_11885 [Macrococcus caseolyticus]